MIEPGARLAGRYRLDESVSETSGASLWKATDETLARVVGVWTFTDGFARTSEVVRAARAAARVADARVTQVFDADDSGPTAYVVEEFVVGQSLTELLAQGPLEPQRAAGLVAEAAEALAAANATGIHHLSLTPGKLMWSAGGAVKVTGIGVDAALRGVNTEDPVAADAQGLGRLLYAALTGHWPGGEHSTLPPAPLFSGQPCEPGQIRAGIPERFNDVVCRSAFQRAGRGAPLRSAKEFAQELSDIPRMVPIPVGSTYAPPPTRQRATTAGAAASGAAAPPREPHSRRRSPDRRSGSPLNKVLVGAVALLVLAAVVFGAWTLGGLEQGEPTSQENEPDDPKAGRPELDVLEPKGAKGFDPGGDGGEHSAKAKFAIDGDPSTSWQTEGYDSAGFGNLKSGEPGVGMIIDMGAATEIHEATVTLGGSGKSAFELRLGDSPELSALKSAGKGTGSGGEVPVKLSSPVKARYALVWFTEIPPDGSGRYRGEVNEVELRGTT